MKTLSDWGRPGDFAIDWGQGPKLAVHDGGKRATRFKKGFRAFLEQSPAPKRIVIESSFESYDRSEKNKLIDLAEQRGTEIWTLSPRKTKNVRLANGIEKTDLNDAEVIWAVAAEGNYNFAKPRKVVELEATPMNRVELLRRRGYPKQQSKEFTQLWPKPAPELLRLLGDGEKFSPAALNPYIGAALEAAGDRDKFDRLVGAYGHGYPSLVRSGFYRRVTSLVIRRMCKGGKRSLKGFTPEQLAPIRKEEGTALRKATRQVFQHVTETMRAKAIP